MPGRTHNYRHGGSQRSEIWLGGSVGSIGGRWLGVDGITAHRHALYCQAHISVIPCAPCDIEGEESRTGTSRAVASDDHVRGAVRTLRSSEGGSKTLIGEIRVLVVEARFDLHVAVVVRRSKELNGWPSVYGSILASPLHEAPSPPPTRPTTNLPRQCYQSNF